MTSYHLKRHDWSPGVSINNLVPFGTDAGLFRRSRVEEIRRLSAHDADVQQCFMMLHGKFKVPSSYFHMTMWENQSHGRGLIL